MERFEKQLTAIIVFASYNYFRNIRFSCPVVYEINMIFLNAGLIFTPEVFIQCKKVQGRRVEGSGPRFLSDIFLVANFFSDITYTSFSSVTPKFIHSRINSFGISYENKTPSTSKADLSTLTISQCDIRQVHCSPHGLTVGSSFLTVLQILRGFFFQTHSFLKKRTQAAHSNTTEERILV